MSTLPDRDQQIISIHAQFIVAVARACANPEARAELEPVLQAAQATEQHALVSAVRRILAGSRDLDLLQGLDPDDTVIIKAVLRGLQDPNTLPMPRLTAEPAAAAPGLAAMIHEAGRGNPEALQILSSMAEQMVGVGGPLARVGGIMRRLVNGEREPEALCKGMDPQSESLVLSILEELGRLDIH